MLREGGSTASEGQDADAGRAVSGIGEGADLACAATGRCRRRHQHRQRGGGAVWSGLVPGVGLEPTHLAAGDFESGPENRWIGPEPHDSFRITRQRAHPGVLL